MGDVIDLAAHRSPPLGTVPPAEGRRPEIAISRVRTRIVVALRGTIDAEVVPRLRHVVWDLIEGQGNLDLVVDLAGVDAIDAFGLELFVGASDKMRLRGGRIEVRGLERVRRGRSSAPRMAVRAPDDLGRD